MFTTSADSQRIEEGLMAKDDTRHRMTVRVVIDSSVTDHS